MRKLITSGALAAAFGAALAAASPAPATAQLARPQAASSVAGGNDLTTEVQYRRGWRGGYRGRYYGPGIGLGLGLATGALIGGALAAPYYYAPAPRVYYDAPDDSVAYCMQRYRSYDPASGTYLGYDGLRHPCP